jgi:chemotaxis protein MotB
MDAVQKKVQELIDQLGLEGDVSVISQERGIYISIGEHVLFKSGSAELSKEAKERIIKIGKEILTKMPDNQMRVEGHTDDIPINTPRFPDNQELSTARANNVWRVLVKDAGIDPTKLSAIGYGEFRPIVPNDTQEHRKMNRRVDIVIMREIYDVTEPGSENTNKSEETSKTGSGGSAAD